MIPSSSVSVSGAGAVPVSSGPGPMMGMNIGPGGRSRGPDISPAVVHSEGWRPPGICGDFFMGTQYFLAGSQKFLEL